MYSLGHLKALKVQKPVIIFHINLLITYPFRKLQALYFAIGFVIFARYAFFINKTGKKQCIFKITTNKFL